MDVPFQGVSFSANTRICSRGHRQMEVGPMPSERPWFLPMRGYLRVREGLGLVTFQSAHFEKETYPKRAAPHVRAFHSVHWLT